MRMSEIVDSGEVIGLHGLGFSDGADIAVGYSIRNKSRYAAISNNERQHYENIRGLGLIGRQEVGSRSD